MDISGKVALVTGGGSGMGEAVCHRLASKGATVIVLDRVLASAKRVAEAIGGHAVECDVSREDELESSFSQWVKNGQWVSIVVNCAGIAPAKRMVGKQGPVPLAWFEEVIKINLVGTFNVMRLSVAQMQQHSVASSEERGVIINTASIAGYEGQVGQTAYSASKGGVMAMTLPAARECAPWGIRVMSIAPGLIDTPMMGAFSDEVKAALMNTALYPKRLGYPVEFASLVQHIIENPFLNGEVIRLDGAVRLPASG